MYMDVKIDGKETIEEQIVFLEKVKDIVLACPLRNVKVDAWADGDCIYVSFEMDMLPEGVTDQLLEFKHNVGAHMDIIPTNKNGISGLNVCFMFLMNTED